MGSGSTAVLAKRDRQRGRMCSLLLFLLYVLTPNLSCVQAFTDPSDVSALSIWYSSLGSPPQLTGWISNGDPCGQSWRGITCSGSSVTDIKLSGLGLSGSMGYNLDSLKSIFNLDLSNNNFNGDIPYNLPPNSTKINLSGNNFTGGIPYSVSKMSSLSYLNLAHNQLQTPLVDMFGGLSSLNTLDLSYNKFSGILPNTFISLSRLTSLYLQYNQFTGTIDVLATLPLENLNVAYNQFTGPVPSKLKNIQNIQIDGNNWGLAPPSPPGGNHDSGVDNSPNGKYGGRKKPSISGGGVAGIVIAILLMGGVLAFFILRRRYKSSSDEEKLNEDQPFTLLGSNETKEIKSLDSLASTTTAVESIPSRILKLPPVEHQKSFNDEERPKMKIAVKRANTPLISASVFSVADLQMATESFSIDNLVGEGSTGRVYMAHFPDGKVLAVKKIDSSSLPNQDPDEFMEVVSNISHLHHPNITELVGYCYEHGQYLLVYEYLKNGSLHDYLHLYDDFSKALTWNARVKIALGTARALEYLHEVCSPSVIHKNFKSANILLDVDLNPHLSDCGLCHLVPSTDRQASHQNSGSGYNAPEVAMSGQYTHKSDIYSFGVVMLELMTGRMPFDSSRPRQEQSLVRWATPQLHDIDALTKMVDPALKELYPVKSLSRFADVIALCVQLEPEFRPPMSEVVQSLVTLVQRANMSKRTVGSESMNSRPADADG